MPNAQTSTSTNKILKAIWNYNLISGFKFGYRNREDNTLLPQGVLIYPSKNMLNGTDNKLGNRQGYTLDGATSGVSAPILASYDYEMHTGDIQHLRAGYLTSAGNDGKLQYRYVASDGTVTWRDLMTGLTTTNIRFTPFWNTTKVQSRLLFVKGDTNIYEWSGGVTTIASVTTNTITTNDTSWALKGFTDTGSVVIGGTAYAYTGGYGTATLTGVTPDPTGTVAGSIAHQAVVTVTNSSMSLALNRNDLISSLNNQVYVAATNENNVYVSKQNDYTIYTNSTPRKVGEGATLYLDGYVVGFMPQEKNMYICSGKSNWYNTTFTLSSSLADESLTIDRLKTGALQAAQSQELIGKDKNDIVFVSNEPTLSTIGRVESILGTPQTVDISWPIINDFNSYDFTDGAVTYWRNFLIVSVPKEGVIRMYNQTDPKNPIWECPQTIPVSRFSIIDGELYGHSYLTSDTYHLFDGWRDLDNPIVAVAKFSFMNMGNRVKKKGFNEWYTEGYCTNNGDLTLGLQYDLDGKETNKEWKLPKKFIFNRKDTSSLGKVSLGKQPLGAQINPVMVPEIPPKFRWIKNMPTDPLFWELSPTYYSNDLDFQWSLACFGPNTTSEADANSEITG
jgi:hypothetical protein